MNVMNTIRQRVSQYDVREPIFFDKLIQGLENERNTAYAAINKLIKSGNIERFEKGIYYRPKKTRFGSLGIDKSLLIKKKYLGDDMEKGYITGPEIWNKWGLTTQISNRKWIVQETNRNYTVKDLNVLIIKSKNNINKDYIKVFQFLDVVDQIDKIPDTTNEKSLQRLIDIYRSVLTPDEQMNTLEYAVNYKIKVQILVGLIADTAKINDKYFNAFLKKYENQINSKVTKKMKIKINPEIFEFNKKWRNVYDTTRIS